MHMEVGFSGNKRVRAEFEGFTVETDQSKDEGGDASTPSPFALFIASLATCAGVYMQSFMEQRGIPTHDAGLMLDAERDPRTLMGAA